MSENHITKEELWYEFYGNFGRDLGIPQRRFSNNPADIYEFIADCTMNKLPAFISVNPKQDKDTVCGLEKLFFDFDCYTESDHLTESEVNQRKSELEDEIRFFLKHLEELNIKPLVVKTNKGYHVYVFFDYIYKIEKNQQEFYKRIYEELQRVLLEGHDYKYIDRHVIGDMNRLCRIPFSTHQKSGQVCIVVDNQLRPDKIRSLEFFRLYGLRKADIEAIIKRIVRNKKSIDNNPKEYSVNTNSSFKDIRPCFRRAMDAGEMCHDQRLALLLEIYSLGNHDVDSIVEYFKCFNDFNEAETSKQVTWFIENEVERGFTKPYRCKTIADKGWCLGEQCTISKGIKQVSH